MKSSRYNSIGNKPGSESGGFSDADVEVQSLVVAHYIAEATRTYGDIEKLLGLSRATIARRIKYAEDRGWLVRKPVMIDPRHLPQDLRNRYESFMNVLPLQKELLEHLQRYGVRRITVVPDKPEGEPDSHEVARRVAQAAADRLSAILAEFSGVVGVNWGYSTRWVVQYLKPSDKPNRNLIVVPLMGNLSVDDKKKKESEEVWLCSANRLARLVAETFQAPDPGRLTAPAIIPAVFKRNQDLQVILRFIDEDLSYQRVFGRGYHSGKRRRGRALIDDMQIIITGMSALEPTSSLVEMAKLVEKRDIQRLRRAGYVGDLGGVLIDDPYDRVTDPEALKTAQRLSRLVIAPKPEDFVRIAQQARNDADTGVFMIGRRPEKARAFIAACRMGAVNELFTDKATGERMLEILKGKANH